MATIQIAMDEFAERARQIRLVILDCDGVLTDGSIVYDEMGREIKRFHVRDGFGVKCWQRAGHQIAVISGRYSQTLAWRCRELGIAPVVQGEPNKESAYRGLLHACGVKPFETCMIGDDLPDLPLILASGIGVAVADADPLVRQRADMVTEERGGRGAIREALEILLVQQGYWTEVVQHYTRSIVPSEG
jgi:3-deoxy-D-manno-octulosonate 8-phosphate phosphatase (KDO 8-P phosphatase)